MRVSSPSDSFRLAVVVPVLVVFLAAPILGYGAAKKITEDVYVSDAVNKRVYVLEAIWKGKKPAKTKLAETITRFKAPADIAVGGGVALVVDDKFVWVIDTATRTALGKVKTGKKTRFVAVTSNGTYGFATQGRKRLKVIDLAKLKVVAKIKTGKVPSRVKIDDQDEFGAVVNLGDDSITIFDLEAVLARLPGAVDGAAANAAAGVRTLKADVCELSGGLDVATFGEFGTWAIWSCGGTPVAAAQQANISDDSAALQNYPVPDQSTSNFVAWNPNCSNGFQEDGIVGSDDLVVVANGREDAATSFRYDWSLEKTTDLGPGQLLNHHTMVDADRSQLSFYNPKGINQGKVGVWNVPDDGEIVAAASTLTGVPVVCDR